MSRRSEIEAKKARIAELRKQREILARSEPSQTLTTPNSRQLLVPREEIDELVNSLVGRRSVSNSPDVEDAHVNSPTRPSAGLDSSPSALTKLTTTNEASTETLDTVVTEIFEVSTKSDVIVYNKEVQTNENWISSSVNERSSSTMDGFDEYDISIAKRRQLEDQIRAELEEEYNSRGKAENASITTSDVADNSTAIPNSTIHILPPEEASQISNRKDFDKFWSQSWKVINRAAEEDNNYNILLNYAESQENSNKQKTNGDSALEISRFYSKDSIGRAITSIDWSSKFPELIAASYTEKSSDPNLPKGLIQIFNLHAPNRPEYLLTAQSDILTVKFSPFDPNLVFGGAYNGQILAWDLRTGSSRPILKSQLSGRAHTHPVYSLQIIGTQNASTIVTASTDGTVCTWTPDMFAKPQDKISLLTASSTLRNDEAAPSSLVVSSRDQTQFLVGTEEGVIYQCNRFGQAGTKAGIDLRGSYQGHTSPVTSIDLHPSSGLVDLGNYLLSCGSDWSIKLWSTRQFSPSKTGPSSSTTSKGEIIHPILDIKRDDIVYDIAWNPSHPSIFADVDGTGHVEIWDLLKDYEMPITRVKPSNIQKDIIGSNYLNRPLNCVAWEKTAESRRLATGGLDGSITVFELESNLVPAAKPDNWAQLKRLFSQFESPS